MRPAGRRRTVGVAVAAIAMAVFLTAFAAPAGAATNPCGGVSPPPATYAHVVVIMEENLSYTNAIGSAKAPYLNQLAGQCALATNFHNETHGSQPNYMAATSGVATGTGAHSSNTSLHLTTPAASPASPSFSSSISSRWLNAW